MKELEIQEQLWYSWGGEKEVNTAAGKIDLLLDNVVIEIKKASLWKWALGQVLAYQHCFPSRQMMICLFGRLSQEKRWFIESVCKEFKVVVYWFDYSFGNIPPVSHLTTADHSC